ncbi:Undecaprenyl-diphosphatase (EC 3.6.1.27) [uncultured Gammaproteobacteria bacterium]|jgi:undecaprenyl-diphosphatase|nr:Undecaprenyl-diphosphatase (EC 3.6.1.27) [uncultured Gammaproteobacteria bacterium]SHE21670.1 Undecaprenyl-diphosphatase [Bathymodiolus brooksi thiotrophic gill symbiont]CAC9604458.1 Undecaprenyl-diphosphatase (EC 3.6.1.27) [uncultured Gammaproteobacteria bacterium]CAC9633377.1 Undecaprenyl-diphosphatase (EC 3.6.1.27) [uncultured Gammaproteobacteria bacterium]CAC9949897.1 Undecaprenyl-diphosphatase (EC 3.6.1.27) [uncultured Gammaproteobacteria bacterium]
MDFIQIIILAIVQGVSEFLPISSSAHLILVPKLGDWVDQGLAFDVVLHLGTLSAVIFYYRHSIGKIIIAFFSKNPNTDVNSKLGWGVIIATIPVGIVGLLFKGAIEDNLRSSEVIAYATLLFGLLLGLADYLNRKHRTFKTDIDWLDMLIIGSFQALALIPGTSRSGITITAALLLGFGYKLALKFSFLLSIPVIVLSSILIFVDLYRTPEQVDWIFLITGFLIAGIFAYLTLHFFIKSLEKISMLPFVAYRIILAVILLAFF